MLLRMQESSLKSNFKDISHMLLHSKNKNNLSKNSQIFKKYAQFESKLFQKKN